MSLMDSIGRAKVLWATWNVKSFVLLSFGLQCILVLGASFRKRTSNIMVTGLIWSAYLLADWAAYYAVGLIRAGGEADSHTNLLALWAPFLLLHLGGPDTITAFALEDNDLWHRSGLHLAIQAAATALVLFRFLPSEPALLGPSVLMFMAAIIRYSERILALYNASSTQFQSSTLVEQKKSESWANMDLPSLEAPSSSRQRRSYDVRMVKDAYGFFQKYKGVFSDLPYSFYEARERRCYFTVQSAVEIFTEMEIELNIAYELFFTKLGVILRSKVGQILHPISFLCELVALVLWILQSKHGYSKADVRITYALLIGALVVDTISFFRLLLSDLMVSQLTSEKKWVGSSFLTSILNVALSARKDRFGRFLFHRWSDSISQFNLVKYSLNDCHKRCGPTIFGKLYRKLTRGNYVSQVWLSEELGDFIFQRLKLRVEYAVNQLKTEQMLTGIGRFIAEKYEWAELRDVFEHSQLAEALIMWHVVSEFCCRQAESEREGEPEPRDSSNSKSNLRRFSKTLSDYMMYVLMQQPTMISEGLIMGEIIFSKVCDRLKETFEKEPDNISDVEEYLMVTYQCHGPKKTLNSMLAFSLYFVKFLKDRKRDEWELILSDMWVELLCHAAIHCKARAHVAQLSKGGELLSVVWLMMAHLGLSFKFAQSVDAYLL